MSVDQKECIGHASKIETSVADALEADHSLKEKSYSMTSVSRPTTPDGNDSSYYTGILEKSKQEDPLVSNSGTETDDDDARSDASAQSNSCLVIVNYVPDSWTEARLRHQFKP